MAFNYEHVVSLFYFDDKIELKCEFTELFLQFKEIIKLCKPRGSTRLWDCIESAIKSLLSFKTQYPDTILRIISLTDGQDNASSVSPVTVAQNLVKN